MIVCLAGGLILRNKRIVLYLFYPFRNRNNIPCLKTWFKHADIKGADTVGCKK